MTSSTDVASPSCCTCRCRRSLNTRAAGCSLAASSGAAGSSCGMRSRRRSGAAAEALGQELGRLAAARRQRKVSQDLRSLGAMTPRTMQERGNRRPVRVGSSMSSASVSFAACDVLGRAAASRLPSRRRRHRGRHHAPSASATALRVGQASPHPPAFQPRSLRGGQTALEPLLRLGRLAGQAGYRLQLTSSRWPCGSAFVGLVRLAGRDRQNPSDQSLTFQYVLHTVSKRNSSVKAPFELSPIASMDTCCGPFASRGYRTGACPACMPEKDRLRFPSSVRTCRSSWHGLPTSRPTFGALRARAD